MALIPGFEGLGNFFQGVVDNAPIFADDNLKRAQTNYYRTKPASTASYDLKDQAAQANQRILQRQQQGLPPLPEDALTLQNFNMFQADQTNPLNGQIIQKLQIPIPTGIDNRTVGEALKDPGHAVPQYAQAMPTVNMPGQGVMAPQSAHGVPQGMPMADAGIMPMGGGTIPPMQNPRNEPPAGVPFELAENNPANVNSFAGAQAAPMVEEVPVISPQQQRIEAAYAPRIAVANDALLRASNLVEKEAADKNLKDVREQQAKAIERLPQQKNADEGLQIPGLTLVEGTRPNETAINKAREQKSAYDNLNQTLNDWEGLYNQYGTTINPASKEYIKVNQKRSDLVNQFRVLANTGVLNPMDVPYVENLFATIDTTSPKNKLLLDNKDFKQNFNDLRKDSTERFGNNLRSLGYELPQAKQIEKTRPLSDYSLEELKAMRGGK